MPLEIAPGVFQIDTKLGGWDQITSAYLIAGDSPALIEVGSQTSVGVLVGELEDLGIGANDLASVALTHIHLDHAGGIGEISKLFPNATVYVHERGARHLADPSRLNASAGIVYGDLLDNLYGRLISTPNARIKVVGDNDFIRVSKDRSIEVINSPGHAKHHLGFFDSSTGLIFTGDAAGILLPEMKALVPATPPSDFDLNSAIQSLEKFKKRNPSGLAFAHFGVYDSAVEVLDSAIDSLRAWAETAKRAFIAGKDIAAELKNEFGQPSLDHENPNLLDRLDLLNGVNSNAEGLKQWIERQDPQWFH